MHMAKLGGCVKAWAIAAGLLSLAAAASAEGPQPAAAGGLKVWAASTIQPVSVVTAAGAAAPISLVGVRNGTFDAQIIVSDDKPIKALKVAVSELKSDGGQTLGASAAQVRFAQPDDASGSRPGPLFDSLEDIANLPGEIAVASERKGSIVPIWILVSVPADAKAGRYSGKVTVSADGVSPATMPLSVRVLDWALPAPQSYTTRMDLIQSPDSVAMAYNVPMWSDAHLKLLDQSFGLLAPLACKSLYVTAIRRTHFGNEHAMVRWVLGDDGELTPEFGNVEKYLDAAIKRLGKPQGVILYCWEPPESGGHAGGTDSAARLADRKILITVLDPKTGGQTDDSGPAWGTPESKAFWKKMTTGIAPVLKKRGLENSLMFGLAGDWRPTKLAMDDVCNGVTDARWAGHSHLKFSGDNNELHGYTMGMASILWGIGVAPIEPAKGVCYGWSNPFWMTYFSRNEIKQMYPGTPLTLYRLEAERYVGARPVYTKGTAPIVGAGASGLGRVGADFWPVLKSKRGPAANLPGRFPEAYWGQLNLNNGVAWTLGQGKNGPIPTVRSEMMREGLQELEARIYLEKAYLDDGAKALLGDDLRGRIRACLDERIKAGLTADKATVDSAELFKRTELLFSLAAEVATKYAGKEPSPNIKPEAAKKSVR